jgi:hypothetical protein
MLDAETDGYHAVWCYDEDKPLKKPLDRSSVPTDNQEDHDAWLKGYDAATADAKAYNDGYAVGIVNTPDPPFEYSGPWQKGYNSGVSKFFRRAVMAVIKTVKPWDYMLHCVYYPCEDMTGQTEDYRGGEEIKKLSRIDVMNEVAQFLLEEDGDIPTTIEQVLECYNAAREDGDWGQCRVITKKAAKQHKADKEYAEMERVAQAFASSCKHGMGTLKFLRALELAIGDVREQRAQWNKPEVRMEEWAAHMYAGSRDAYFDDLNFENGRYANRIDNLQLVWDYIERKFPLLMMQYREHKARRAAKKK